jgi:aryl-alcohol dehydrogenase-like predicted oxidoreductase
MEFSGGGGPVGAAFPRIPQSEKNAVVQAALAGGINWFDTAEIYGAGESERSLAAALRAAGKADHEVVIATKWFPVLRTARNIPQSIQDRIRFLGGYSIGLYMVHQPYGLSSPEAEMSAMADLVQAGTIRSVGVSNFGPERMRRAHKALQDRGLPLAANQVHYSMLRREIETNGILDTARDLGVTIIAYTPLASGLLTGKYHKNPDLLRKAPFFRRSMMRRRLEATRPLIALLEEIGMRHQATPGQVALNWLIHFKGDMVVAIPAATKAKQAQDNAGAMRFRLTEEEMDRLDRVSLAVRP